MSEAEFDEIYDSLDEMTQHQIYMQMAYQEAQAAEIEDEVPVGAIIVHKNKLIASAHNQCESLKDPTAHAEMIAITQATQAIDDWRLEESILYVTLEPCPMCAGAILQSRIPRIVYGAKDPKAGAVSSMFTLLNDSRLNHQCEVIEGVMADSCGQILTDFFRNKRKQGKK